MSVKEQDRILDNIRWCRIHRLYQQMNESLKEAKTLIDQAKEFQSEIERLEKRFDGVLKKRKEKADKP